MKSILAIVTFLGLAVCSSALAQTNAAAGEQPASTQPAAGGAMSVHIEPTPLTTVIETLARQAGINYILDPKVQLGPVGPDGKAQEPSITLRWDNVTAGEALTALLNNYNLQIVEDPKTKIARITNKDPAALPALTTEIVQLKFASPSNIVTAVQTVLRDPRSKVVPDVRTSQLIVSATEPELKDVGALVASLDTQTKQVLIEALLMETTRNPSTMKGVDWSSTLTAQNITFGNNALAGTPATPAIPTTVVGGTVIPGTPATPGTIGGILSDPKLLMSASKGPFFSPATAFLNADGVSAVLSFINKDADSQVLSTPRAVTLDNQEAVLSVSRALPIFASTAGTQGSPGGSQVTYTNLGTMLRVTPRISANDFINLKVKPEVSSLAGVARKTVAGVVNEADIYDIRTISTEVMIPSGNTLVLGGLVSDDQSKGYTKVPLLGDLPLLGLAFRSENKTQLKKNLLIFITPTIVKDTDFQPSRTEFLKSRPAEVEVLGGVNASSAWESAKPHDWSNPNSTAHEGAALNEEALQPKQPAQASK